MSEHEEEQNADFEAAPDPLEAEEVEAEETEPEPSTPDDGSEGEGDDAAGESNVSPSSPPEDGKSIELQDREMAALQKKLVRLGTGYAQKMVDALGPDLNGFVACPLCADFYPGFRLPIQPEPHALAATRVAIGLEPGDNLPHDGYSRACSACDGWGFVDSGSKVPGQSKLTCYDCGGKGWTAVGDERASGAVTAPNGNVVPIVGALQDAPSNDPPEVERLKQLGYVVVPPIVTENPPIP